MLTDMTIVLICYKMEKSKLQKADIMFFNTYVHTLKKKKQNPGRKNKQKPGRICQNVHSAYLCSSTIPFFPFLSLVYCFIRFSTVNMYDSYNNKRVQII